MDTWIAKISPTMAIVCILILGCAKDRPSQTTATGSVVISARFRQSSLVEQIKNVDIQVISAGELTYASTLPSDDNTVNFNRFELPVGEMDLHLFGVNEFGGTLYAADTTIWIISGKQSNIDIELFPTLPMIKLSPYWISAGVCENLICTLDLYNIERFYRGSFTIQYLHDIVELSEIITIADTAWGNLSISTENKYETCIITCSRPEEDSDIVPPAVTSLLEIRLKPIRTGDISLRLIVDSIEDHDGVILEWLSIYVDGQTISVTGDVFVGAINGMVTDAQTGLPIANAFVIYGDHYQVDGFTDENGYYHLEEIPLGTMFITASALDAGYGFVQKWAAILCDTTSIEINFRLVSSS